MKGSVLFTVCFNSHRFLWVTNSAWKPQNPTSIVPIELLYKCFLGSLCYSISTDFISAEAPGLAQQLRPLLWSNFQWDVLTPWPSWHLFWEQMEKTVHNIPVGLKAEILVVPWVACWLPSIQHRMLYLISFAFTRKTHCIVLRNVFSCKLQNPPWLQEWNIQLSGIKSLARRSVCISPWILKLSQFRKASGYLFSFHLQKTDTSRNPTGGFWLSKQRFTASWVGISAQHYKHSCQRSWLESWCDGVMIRRKVLPRLSCLPLLSAIPSLLKSWKANVFLRCLMGRWFLWMLCKEMSLLF